ncbi:MAG: M48 family metalloprotease [Kiritimatiellae bacterium]|nr:M48 family metalloprotease [Kiritimatiellia bacterium]
MSKTFFDHQQAARVRTRWALFGFMVAILLTVVSVGFVTGFGLYGFSQFGEDDSVFRINEHWQAIAIASGTALAIILIAGLIRHVQMMKGPEHVMTSMGGWRVPPDTSDGELKQLRNVVEEMAIASGIPVPETYVLNERGINACAVGMDVDRAAVGVTFGALATFTRDELQGVIAHEFSHILHGDMRLNTRLISWLAGLFTISELGTMLIHWGSAIASQPRRSKDDNSGAIGLVFIAFGVAVWICGSIGLFFGKILQAAISRQREYLADAAAVQFTRNPAGIANALRKLGKGGARGKLTHAESMECAHMMFGNLNALRLSGLLATHPPLPRRIRQVDPSWDGSYLDAGPVALRPQQGPPPIPHQARKAFAAGAAAMGLMDQVGMPSSEAMREARAWLGRLPQTVLAAAPDDAGAQALVYRLLLQDRDDVFEIQAKGLMDREEPVILETLQKILQALPEIDEADRLPLLDLCIPALRALEPHRREAFAERIRELIAADGKVNLFELAVRRIVFAALESEQEARARRGNRIHINNAGQEVNILLSTLSRLGADNQSQAEESFEAARNRMIGYHGRVQLELLPADDCELQAFNDACETLAKLAPAFQQRLILAGLAAVAVDGEIRPAELNAFRAAAASLNIPVSPALRVSATEET